MSFEKLAKMSGYLEKRGKLSILGRWKKWWCVLEGQLLLYYKSRIDYAKLSPCCGSLNMALVRSVQPHIRCQIHIVTHTQLIIMRTKNKEKQQQWFHALVGVLPQHSYLSPIFCFPVNPIEPKRKRERNKKKSKLKTAQDGDGTDQTINDQETSFHRTDRLIQENKFHNDISIKCQNEPLTESQNISMMNESKSNVSISKLLLENSIKRNNPSNNLRRYSSYHNIPDAVHTIQSENMTNRRSISYECILNDCKIIQRSQSKINESFKENVASTKPRKKCKRSESDIKKNDTLTRKSFSFLKKMFNRKSEFCREEGSVDYSNKANEKNIANICQPDVRPSIDLSSDGNQESRLSNDILDSFESETENINSSEDKIERTSIDHSIIEEDFVTSDISGVAIDSSTDQQFENNSKCPTTDKEFVDNENMYSSEVCLDLDYSMSEYHEQNSNDEICATEFIKTEPNLDILDSLLLQLTTLSHNDHEKSLPSLEFANNEIEDPDYDIPIPHHSFAQKHLNQDYLERSSVNSTSNKYTDSLSLDMAPDSLEMPWMINSTLDANVCSSKNELSLGLDNDSDSDYGYHDSLNSNKYYA